MKKLLVLSVVVCFTLVSTAQEKLTEGVITTKQSISTDNPQMQAQIDAMGEMTSKTFFKGTNSRVESNNVMTGPMTIITSKEEMKSLTLMDNPMLGKKFVFQNITVTPESMENITVEDGEGTKTILGYDCKEKIVTMVQNGAEVKMSMFVTDAIAPVMTQQTSSLGDKIKGYPLYTVMNMTQQGMAMTVTMEVTEVNKATVADDKFDMTPPEGYTKMEGM